MEQLLLLSVLIIIAFTSCSNEENGSASANMVDVTVTFDGMNITTQPLKVPARKASNKTASEASVNSIMLKAIDANGTAQGEVTQSSTVANFGTITMRLPVGDYKFVAVANSTTTAATITSATETSIAETDNVNMYTLVKDVTIAGNTTQNITMDMGTRKNTLFLLDITDDTPAAVQTIQILISPSESTASSLKFNPTTGLASSVIRYEHSVSKSKFSDATFKGHTLGDAFLLTAAEQQLDVTINALSSTGTTLYTRNLTGVTFKQGCSTTATGTLFSPVSTSTFSFGTSVGTSTSVSLD